MKQEKEELIPLQGSWGWKPSLPVGIFRWWGHSGPRTGRSVVVPPDGMFGIEPLVVELGEMIVLL